MTLTNRSFLYLYHMLFTLIAFWYVLGHKSDARLYWFCRNAAPEKSWGDYFNVGTDFLLFLNYPFAVILNLPFWFGFLLYGTIGYFGILQFQKLTYDLLGNKDIRIKGLNVLPLLFYLPNLHFWTGMLGKEALCFLWLSTIFLKIAEKKYKSLWLWLSSICLFLLRPHVFIMLLVPLLFGFIFHKKISLKYKIAFSLIGLIIGALAYYFFLILSEVQSFNWARLQRFNLGSILSFRDTGSYVPIHEYSYLEKFFAFFFRPLFYDANNIYQYAISIENLLLIIIHLVVIFLIFKYYSYVRLAWLDKIILGFVVFSFVLFVQRYAGLGIFVRTKIMLQPFLLILLLKVLKQIKDNKKINYESTTNH